MKIVLAEDRSGKLVGERTFTSEVVRIGRDPAECHYFFTAEQWPMVSRKHAEFRLGEGRCFVADSNSRFGTFVNGQKIAAPVEVRVGANVQLGAGDPFAVTDLKSFNGTLVNGQRIAGTVTLFGGDQIQLGAGGPVVSVVDPAHPAPAGPAAAAGAQTPVMAPSIPPAFGQIAAMAKRETIVVSSSSGSISPTTPPAGTQPHLLARRSFDQQAQFTVGRAPDNDIRLDGLQISNR